MELSPPSIRQSDQMMPAERMFQMVTGFAISQAVYVAAKLGLADLLKDGPKGSDELAKSVDANGAALVRLLRFLASAGIFVQREDGRFDLTPLSECLQTGVPASMRTWAIFWGESWVWRPWGELLYSVKTGQPAFDHIYGTGTFDFFEGNPEAAEIFHGAMRVQAETISAAVVAACDFSAASNIVDVGGGDGSFLASILKMHPGTRGILFDQHHAIDKAKGFIEADKLGDRCELVAGDFFKAVPRGGDVYVLKLILHDWDDERSITILKNCRRSMTENSRLLVVEHIIRPGNEPDIGKLLDLNMLVRQFGRERTESEYRALFTAAGLKVTKFVPTRSPVSVIEGVAASYELELPHQKQDGKHGVGPTNAFTAFKEEEIEKSIPDRFEQQVTMYPDRLAVKTRSYALTYRELNQTANRLAQAILEVQDKREEPIALLFEKDAPMIAAILGVLKAGKIYVPLDPAHPHERSEAVLEDSRAKIIVSNRRNLTLASERARNGRQWINIDELDPALSSENLGLPVGPDTLAYILYTSGSTGYPKGVVQNHRNILYKTMTYTNDLHFCLDDRIALLSPYTFSLSVGFIFGALLNGACLYPVDVKEEGLGRLASWLTEEGITVYNSVPTVFRFFTDSLTGEHKFPKLRLIHLGGEPATARDVELYRRRFSSNCVFVHHMGSNETGSIGQYFLDKATPVVGGTVPAGYAVKGTEVILLDDTGNEVSSNEIGEIALRSRYLAVGYWRNPELTRSAFRPDAVEGDKRVFRTGDLGRKRPDGCLEYLGRKDSQIKVSGQKVAIAEIERTLLSLDIIKEAVVVVQENVRESPRIVAYFVPSYRQVPTVGAVRRALAEKLPGYMIPSAYVALDALPLTSNGKVDRKALPDPGAAAAERDNEYVAPCTAMEKLMAEIWQKVLGIDRVSAHDNFFDLGGHSLLSLDAISKIEQKSGQRIQPREIVMQTLRQIAALYEQTAPAVKRRPSSGFVRKCLGSITRLLNL